METFEGKTPGEWAAGDGNYDCTLFIGQLCPTDRELSPPWPMLSYSRPGSILWNAVAAGLWERGWSDEEIKAWLQSKTPRYELDGSLGDVLTELGREVAKTAEKV